MRFPNPVRAFRDPRRRPRAIVWLGVALMGFVTFWAVGIVGTSFEWFCTNPCHIVHDDNTAAYRASTHTNVSCIACHEPVNASPLVMTLMKINVLPDLPATVFGTYKVPINPESEVARVMPMEQCTQCHNLDNRKVTPNAQLIIEHDAHRERNITCTTCHNRVAHPEENITLTIEGNRKHENWMTMDSCFRCHGLGSEALAPGRCVACHPKDFDLYPKSHNAPNWFTEFGESNAHAEAYKKEYEQVEAAEKAEKAADKDLAHEAPAGRFPDPGPSAIVNSCWTCHEQGFCDGCHGLQMPHPADFEKQHGELGKKSPQLCAKCHAPSRDQAAGTRFCDACHHPASVPDEPWIEHHPVEVNRGGAEQCFECHEPTECARCHVRRASEVR